MKQLTVILLIFLLWSGGPVFADAIHVEVIMEAEGIPNWYGEYFTGTCETAGTQGTNATASQGKWARWTGAGFNCSFFFNGSGIGINTSTSAGTVRDTALYIDTFDAPVYTFSGTAADSIYIELEPRIHLIYLVAEGATGTYTPNFDFFRLTYIPEPVTPYPTPTAITIYPTPTEITFPPTPTEITFLPTPTEIEAMNGTPDGATVYATVEADGYAQTVALRYEVDGGQVIIALLLFSILIVLVISMISQWRRRAPEP